MPQCSATSKRTGQQCRARALAGKTVCRMHGGKSRVGAAAGSYRTGRYSKYLPGRLAERYIAARDDPALLTATDEIAVVEARLTDLLARAETGESGQLWRSLATSWRAVEVARAADDADALAAALDELGMLIARGLGDTAVWREVFQAIDQRRRLVESERKRLVEMHQMVTVSQAMTLIQTIMETIRRYVREPQAYASLSAEVGRLLTTDSSGPA